MAGEPMNSEIHRIISEQGWNDSSVLEILWSYVAAQQSEDALTEHFRQMQEQESPSPPEGDDDVEMVTLRFIPQWWTGQNNEQIMNLKPDGPDTFQVPKSEWGNAEDRSYAADRFKSHDNAPEWVRAWSGPFEIEQVKGEE